MSLKTSKTVNKSIDKNIDSENETSGDENTEDVNTEDVNTEDVNTENMNTGDENTGDEKSDDENVDVDDDNLANGSIYYRKRNRMVKYIDIQKYLKEPTDDELTDGRISNSNVIRLIVLTNNHDV